MLGTTHLIAGVAIALSVKQPLLGAFFALASHLALDAVPHWNFPLMKKWSSKGIYHLLPEFLGMGLAYVAFLAIYPGEWLKITLGAFFGIAPDLLTEGRILFRKNIFPSFQRFHEDLQWEIGPVLGLLTQIAAIGLLLGLLLL